MGTGGPRTGAGRPGYRVKAEQLCRVDVTHWQRQRRLQSDCAFIWRWVANGESVAAINVYVTGAEHVTLAYRFANDPIPKDCSTTIRLLRGACNYGGLRYWFECPICLKRVGLLYQRFRRFACRHCQQVAHSSQSEDAHDRAWRKAQRIETRLGPHWKRPKGMRHKTYSRLKERLIDFEVRRDELFERMAALYLWRLRKLVGNRAS